MIDRYTRPEMAKLWSPENKFQKWLEVELNATDAWVKLGHVPEEAAKLMRENAKFTVERIDEIEQSTHHDVVAFTRCVAESLGDESKYLHFGLTSTDVVDTALSAILVEATDMLGHDLEDLTQTLRDQAIRYKDVPMMGRTHGVHAEPITLGLKFALWYADMGRNMKRLAQAREMIAVGKLSGAVGTYANIDPFVEQYVCKKMGLAPAPISTQVLQRDRHAQYVSTLAVIGGTLEKIATEVRALQKTEMREVEEPFSKGQKGSSAMPHKRNPVKSEQICGLSRLLRGYALTSLEDIALWHERDISHSSAERVILADATTLLDYMIHQMIYILGNLHVYPENMMRSMSMSHGLVEAQRVLLRLVEKGMLREDAYDMVQRMAMESWANSRPYREILWEDPKVRELMTEAELDSCFELKTHLTHVDTIFRRLGLLEAY
ncbi:adenylosuccinate lyase [Gehongia tenuis]|uniref:Adenylosuccinate lyase n=1 Tax=Gehongia tenuis TaxID=2763655 RepID=A0A926D2P8_9FIRM|nr:adenylosuccinate lyase [Gehongia tenuis]MBC8531310.1 adenylosuccinate lyase [Gehongia tenuis]